jgi:hypothetical protein
MTRRYTSGFDILGFDTDPTPGDPDTILNQVVPIYQSIGDDSQSALTAMKSNAFESGSGKTMDALNKLIGTEYPPKLQKAADSFQSAASIYTTYAQALADAQNQLDRAMDQATPVADLANTTVPAAPANATPDQVSATQQQQQNVDQASATLTAAKRLAQDAQDLRNQAGNTFNKNLSEVSSIPGESLFQKFLDFFEHNPIFQIFIDIAIAITSIFFPVVGLVLGALDFGLTTAFNTIATGHFDVGAFVVGLATLGLGVGGATGLFEGVGTVLKGVGSSLLKGLGDPGEAIGGFFSSASGSASQGILGQIGKLGDTAVGKGLTAAGKGFTFSVGSGLVGAAIDHQPINAGEILGGAAVGAVVGGAFTGGKEGLGFGEGESEPQPDPKPDPSGAGSNAPSTPAAAPQSPATPDPAAQPSTPAADNPSGEVSPESVPLPPSPTGETPPESVPLPPSQPGSPTAEVSPESVPLPPSPTGETPPESVPLPPSRPGSPTGRYLPSRCRCRRRGRVRRLVGCRRSPFRCPPRGLVRQLGRLLPSRPRHPPRPRQARLRHTCRPRSARPHHTGRPRRSRMASREVAQISTSALALTKRAGLPDRPPRLAQVLASQTPRVTTPQAKTRKIKASLGRSRRHSRWRTDPSQNSCNRHGVKFRSGQ